ncbi:MULTISPECIES: hypothetical protein [Xenorhabdus]|uniref:hypothetical protein n=1 Tax=Xenorhabdus TaxID=626 RepID=UPI00064B1226|nr:MULTISPECIES: hypothetical protein [Xenorhabdus]KLU14258.1 hypothetical protein AAY47_17330 [Xenorhabdus griffiniae]KOP34769.1 hypothetical protein AFK69_02735 [Xenorhabdus sp. GDc328]
MDHAITNGLINVTGSNNAQFKGIIRATDIMTGKQVDFIGKKSLIASGLSSPAVYACLNGRAKTHKGYRFERISLERKSC